MSASDARGAAGFTLLELLVALTIAAALIALMPRLMVSGGGDLAAAADMVAAELRLARERALTQGAPAGVGFDIEGGTVLPEGAAPRPLPAGVALALRTAAEARAALGAPGVVFFPEGGATGGEIALSRGAGVTVVEVRWLTGAVHVR
jgi:general secretion pathway protein H